ncbi:MAG: hypothetical protein AAFY34_10430 [Pseudomonadota bacterium]
MASNDQYGGHVPVVIEDRTIFHPPEIQAQRVGNGGGSQVVTRQSPLMGVIALLAIAACGGLGYLMYQQNVQIENLKTADNTEELEKRDATIRDLQTQVAGFEAAQLEYSTVARLLSNGETTRKSIEDLLAQPLRANISQPQRVKDALEAIPESGEKVAEDALQEQYIDKLDEAYQVVWGWPERPETRSSNNRRRVD